MTSDRSCSRLAVTPGEPAGIGPDIVIAAAQKPFNAELVAIADPDLLQQRAAQLNLPLELVVFKPETAAVSHQPGTLKILPVPHRMAGTPGHPHPQDAVYVLETLSVACKGCLQNDFSAMVTAPVHKAIINEAGFPFTGHTEYLAELCGSGYPVMMLADQTLRVALVTTHLPLSRVSEAITRATLERVINIVWHDLRRRFGIANPKLLVCGLNPHAGEDGHLGREEIDTVIPVLDELRARGLRLTGPVPADTAFTEASLRDIDVVVAMYHDQGLPVLKSRGFGEIVNITLGLPLIRTSVDHGTALSLAGTGRAKSSSLESAIDCAIRLSATAIKPDNMKAGAAKAV